MNHRDTETQRRREERKKTSRRWSVCSITYSSVFKLSFSFLLCVSVSLWFPPSLLATTVGLPAKIKQVLPGSELEVKPLVDRRSPVVMRIVSAEEMGDGFRYEIEYTGLEPGKFDLREYLQRKDRTSTADLPAMWVTIRSVLPPGQVKPHDLEAKGSPWLGGYRLMLIIGGVLWLAGVVAILLVGRRREKQKQAAARPLTLADRLRPLVEAAVAGRRDTVRLAELERTLIVYWTRRLHLDACKPADALTVLRGQPEAGPLLQQLEIWLHHPRPSSKINVGDLLAPYQHLPPDALPTTPEKQPA
jgi:hypothetical protein